MSRRNLTVALLAGLASTFGSAAFAATAHVVDAGRLGKATQTQIASYLNLDNSATLKATKSKVVTVRGTVKTREVQMYNGVPVYGRSVVVERDKAGAVLSVRGRVEQSIAADLSSVKPKLSAAQVQSVLRSARGGLSGLSVNDSKAELFVYPAENGAKARLVYRVSLNAEGPGQATRPFALIDANSGQVIKQWEGLTSGRLPTPTAPTNVDATGIGGNGATGSYFYDGSSQSHAMLKVQKVGMACYLQNDKVKTVNMAGGATRGVVWSFPCAKAPYTSSGDTINGGFSALNDAHHFGGVVHDMYMDWFGEPPLKNDDGSEMQLLMRVHYGTNYVNAFWNGSSMTYGDGDGVRAYPLVVLDVTGHEISHGFTEQHSNLEYTSAQSGGMNEAFSDMAGEAAKFFDRGTNDFITGADLMVPGTVPPGGLVGFRDLCTPSRDGFSIDSADQFRPMDPHGSSGVYNRAFCTLAKTEGWDTRMAFEVFRDANAIAWQSNETFSGGACGVEQAATDRGYDVADVTAAFAVVKVTCTP